jgi:hypothetical protein
MSEAARPERFAEAARLLSGQCALLLGWRPHEFWAATPAEVATIFAASADFAGPPRGIGRDDIKHLLERDGDG